MGIRISEMDEATSFGEDDLVPIVKNGANKKALGSKIKDFIAGFFVSKSGDTMTGDLNTTASFANKYNGVEVDNSSTNHVSSNTQLTSVEFKDKNDFVYSGLNTTLSSNGLIETWLNVKNKKTDGSVVNNYIDLLVAKDGTMSYDVAAPAAFRSAIGIGSYVAQALSQYVTCNDNTYTTIMSGISLAKGTWVICVGVGWAYSGTGSRRIFVTDSATSNSNIRQLIDTSFAATENQQLGISNNVSQVIEFTSDVTLYVKAYQHSGAALNVVAARFSAIRIA